MVAERNSSAAVHHVKGVKEETQINWSREAAQHVEELKALLLANYRLTRVQLVALWTYVGHNGEKGGTQEKTSRALSGVESR